MSSTTSRRFAKTMARLKESDQSAYTAVSDHLARIKSEARSYRLQADTSPSKTKAADDSEEPQQSRSELTSGGGQ